MERGGTPALREANSFFMSEGHVFSALRKITSRLDELGIAYAVADGMALFHHGYRRFTEDVDILVTREGMQAAHDHLEGLGYLPPFRGSKNLLDPEHGVRIEFLIAGDYPGAGKPKPVAFPEPASVTVDIDGIKYLSLPAIVELKLASGMTNPRRMKDLSDVQELISLLHLPRDFADQFNPYVQPKFFELWDAIPCAARSGIRRIAWVRCRISGKADIGPRRAFTDECKVGMMRWNNVCAAGVKHGNRCEWEKSKVCLDRIGLA